MKETYYIFQKNVKANELVGTFTKEKAEQMQIKSGIDEKNDIFCWRVIVN